MFIWLQEIKILLNHNVYFKLHLPLKCYMSGADLVKEYRNYKNLYIIIRVYIYIIKKLSYLHLCLLYTWDY